MVLNLRRFCPQGAFGKVWKDWLEATEARDSPPSQRRIQPQVSVSLWCETRVGTRASLSTGTRVSRSTEGQEMRHRQTWAGVQAVREVTSYPVGLGFILCESGMPKIIRPPVGFLQGCDKEFVLLSGWHRVVLKTCHPLCLHFPTWEMGQDSLCLGVTLKLFPSDTAKRKSHFPRWPCYKIQRAWREGSCRKPRGQQWTLCEQEINILGGRVEGDG